MNNLRPLSVAAAIFVHGSCCVAADYPLRPVPFNRVEMTSDFWRPRLETQRETLVPFAFERTQPGVEHLQAARDFLAGKEVEGHRPHRFIDSDLYKVMEGAAYLLQLRSDPELEQQLDELVRVFDFGFPQPVVERLDPRFNESGRDQPEAFGAARFDQ